MQNPGILQYIGLNGTSLSRDTSMNENKDSRLWTATHNIPTSGVLLAKLVLKSDEAPLATVVSLVKGLKYKLLHIYEH